MFGFGPVFIRCAAHGWNLTEMHGRTAQSYVELILRRPAGLGMAFFTLAVAVVLPCYRRGAGESRDAAIARLKRLVPALLILPQISEEATFFLFIYLAPLVLARRLSARTVAVLVAATAIGALRSGVVLGVLGHRSMATPTLHLSFPPRLPTWAFEQNGDPVALAPGWWFLLAGAGPRVPGGAGIRPHRSRCRPPRGRRCLPGRRRDCHVRQHRRLAEERPRPVSVLRDAGRVHVGRGAALWLFGALRAGRAAPAAVLVGFGLVVCAPTAIYPAWQAGTRLNGEFEAHAIGGELRRDPRAGDGLC